MGQEWEERHKRICSIHMLQVALEIDVSNAAYLGGDIIQMYAGSAAVFDLGPCRELMCEGLVLGMNRTYVNLPATHGDILTVDMVSDLDSSGFTRLACQPLQFDGDLITYFRLEFPAQGALRLGRMFRLRVDPFHPKIGEYCMHDDLAAPLYMLRSVEFFGTLLEVPAEIHPTDNQSRAFVFGRDQVTQTKTRRRQRLTL